MEEKAFKQIEDGLENKINNRQNKDLIEQQLKESVKVKQVFNLFFKICKSVWGNQNQIQQRQK